MEEQPGIVWMDANGTIHGEHIMDITDSTSQSQSGPRGFLLSFPVGVYTCIGVDGRVNHQADQGRFIDEVKDLAFHVARLKEGFATLFSTRWCDLKEEKIADTLRRLLEAYRPSNGYVGPLFVTLLAYLSSPQQQQFEKDQVPIIVGHIMPAPTFQKEAPLVVVTRTKLPGGNRQHKQPRTKSTAWIREREPLEQEKQNPGVFPVPATEVIMLDDENQALLEGLVTNVFVLDKDLKIFTAQEGVLPGSMQNRVLDACKALNLTCTGQPPLLQDGLNNRWLAMWITNASRPLTNVRTVALPNPSNMQSSSAENAFKLVDLPGHEELTTKLLHHLV